MERINSMANAHKWSEENPDSFMCLAYDGENQKVIFKQMGHEEILYKAILEIMCQNIEFREIIATAYFLFLERFASKIPDSAVSNEDAVREIYENGLK